jgi:hypothetical protein
MRYSVMSDMFSSMCSSNCADRSLRNAVYSTTARTVNATRATTRLIPIAIISAYQLLVSRNCTGTQGARSEHGGCGVDTPAPDEKAEPAHRHR